MLEIPEHPGDSSDVAVASVSKLLNEPKTTILVFRSDPQNEDSVKARAVMADQLAQSQNPAEWRVIWIRQPNLVPAIIASYFGADTQAAAASLKWGTGEPRSVGKLYLLGEIADPLDLGGAFSDAGP